MLIPFSPPNLHSISFPHTWTLIFSNLKYNIVLFLVFKDGIHPLTSILLSPPRGLPNFHKHSDVGLLLCWSIEVFYEKATWPLIRGLVGTFSYQLCRKLQIKVVTTILHFSAALKASNTKKRLDLTAVGGFQQLGTIPVDGLAHCGSLQQSIKSYSAAPKVSNAIQPQLNKWYILARKTNIRL